MVGTLLKSPLLDPIFIQSLIFLSEKDYIEGGHSSAPEKPGGKRILSTFSWISLRRQRWWNLQMTYGKARSLKCSMSNRSPLTDAYQD